MNKPAGRLKKQGYFLPLFLLVLFAFASPAHAGQDAGAFYLDGVSLYRAGNYTEAEKRFKAALMSDPKNLSAAYMMGETLSQDIRRLREAEGWYQKVIREGRNDKVYGTKTRLSLSMLYIKMGLNEQAVSQLKELIASSPNYYDLPKVYNYLGVARYRLDQYDEAMDCFKHALKLDGNLLEATFNMKTLQGQLALLNIARYYERMGDEQAAIEQYKKAIESYPDYVAAWYRLGLFQLKRKDYENAVKLLTRAKALNPGYLGGNEIPYQLAAAYTGRRQPGDLDEALKVYENAPSYKDSTFKAGLLLLEKGNRELAEKDFTDTVNAPMDKKTRAEAWYQLGMIYRGEKNQAKAQECLRNAALLDPAEARYKSAADAK